LIVNDPEICPAAVGVNTKVTAQDPPAGRVPGHVFAEIATVEGVTANPLKVIVEVDVFCSIMVCGWLGMPIITLPRKRS
jgi:hypothetical protein